GGSFLPSYMTRSARVYFGFIATAAVVAVGLLARFGAPSSLESATLALFLCAVGGVGRSVMHDLDGSGAHGSAGYLLFPAAALAVADWTVPVAVGATVVILEVRRGARPSSLLFNVSNFVLTSSLCVVVYRLVGGTAWAAHSAIKTLPTIALLLTGGIVSRTTTVIGLSLVRAQNVRQTWQAATARTLVDDVLVTPVAGFVAYAAVNWGYLHAIAVACTLIWVNRLYESNRALVQSSRDLLELMVSAIEARDPYTSGHSRRVARLAEVIGRAVGLQERDVRRIRVAGLVHDVGKIHEKYAPILRKPDRLTKDEWMTMQEHPIDGALLVAKVQSLQDVVPAVRSHHESWDGTGYPDGLKGEAIPLMARVLTFADTIDAMTSDRPYRRALTEPEVRAEIERCKGKQFDPVIAGKLLASHHWSTLFQPVAIIEESRYEIKIVGTSTGSPKIGSEKIA
ncbi:MAG: HD-GYP domain-containing protein, partial [Gemmatimonadota bacterium]|nr:HD-GYP domain-containing protein [Gemmatimonadota bacterium]